jgi:predicted PurR-regulated permease PerM
LAVTAVYFLLILIISWVSILIIPSLVEQANNFMKELPGQIDTLNQWLDQKVSGNGVLSAAVDQIKERISNLSGSISKNGEIIKTGNGQVFGGIVLGLFGGLLNFILVLVFSFYLAIQEHGIENFLRIVTPVKYSKYAINL